LPVPPHQLPAGGDAAGWIGHPFCFATAAKRLFHCNVAFLTVWSSTSTLRYLHNSVLTTGAALAANPRPLQTDLSCPACIASGNFILEFSSINSRSRLFSRWRIHTRSVEQTTSLARACVNVRIGEFMLGNSRTKLRAECMLGRRGEFEGVAICNAEICQPCI